MERPAGAPSPEDMAARSRGTAQQRTDGMREGVLFQALMREQQARNQLEVALAGERTVRAEAEQELVTAQGRLAEWDALFAPKRSKRGSPRSAT